MHAPGYPTHAGHTHKIQNIAPPAGCRAHLAVYIRSAPPCTILRLLHEWHYVIRHEKAVIKCMRQAVHRMQVSAPSGLTL